MQLPALDLPPSRRMKRKFPCSAQGGTSCGSARYSFGSGSKDWAPQSSREAATSAMSLMRFAVAMHNCWHPQQGRKGSSCHGWRRRSFALTRSHRRKFLHVYCHGCEKKISSPAQYLASEEKEVLSNRFGMAHALRSSRKDAGECSPLTTKWYSTCLWVQWSSHAH